MDGIYLLDSCQIYKSFFSINGINIVIPELCKAIEWDDYLFKNYLQHYTIDPMDTSNYASENLHLISDGFFSAIKEIEYYSIFTAMPKNEILKLPYEGYIENSILYKKILDNLIFVGWYPVSYIGSAFMDGYYPCQIENNNIIFDDNKYMLNKFLLIKNLDLCNRICEINSSIEGNQDYWFSMKIYVDKYTYEKIDFNASLFNY